jgi:hypothetical protein
VACRAPKYAIPCHRYKAGDPREEGICPRNAWGASEPANVAAVAYLIHLMLTSFSIPLRKHRNAQPFRKGRIGRNAHLFSKKKIILVAKSGTALTAIR